jgi:mRNA-degrading endonuclease RelE of RelBE toxin-antitoxin system
MSYNIIPTPLFKSQSKRLIKKFPSLKKELAELSNILSETSNFGTPLGNDTFKIRLAVKSKGQGKSGGMRIITFRVDKDKEVYLLTIYD